mgnify:CR=1 FL=1
MTKKILIADDDIVFTNILTRALKRRGLESLVAHSQSEALIQYREATLKPHYAIIDLNMGEDSGLNLIPKLLRFDPRLKMIVLTGYSSIATTVEAIKAGAINYLCKPASVDEVIQAFGEKSLGADQQEIQKIKIQRPSVERIEWEYIQKVLTDNGGNISATARALGMHRRTLQRKLQKKPVKY